MTGCVEIIVCESCLVPMDCGGGNEVVVEFAEPSSEVWRKSRSLGVVVDVVRVFTDGNVGRQL